jgi:NitT/TauT family transport system substrate-binding protein
MTGFLARAALGCGLVLGALASPQAADLSKVSVGITSSASDVSLFVAHKRGYFREEGLDVSFVSFVSAARMIAPMASGDLDVGTGALSAGLYNAVARGIDVRIVADKNSTPPGRGTQPLLVRKDHVDSGRYKGLRDLKGMKIAVAALGTSSMGTTSQALAQGGLTFDDVDQVALGFPEHVAALANKAVDASFTVEPSASAAVRQGLAVRIMGDDEIVPGHQLSVTIFSGAFAKRGDEPRRFLRALLRGVRDFNDGLVNGRYAGPKGDALVAILAEYGPFKDPEIYRSFNTSYSDPDGALNLASIRQDLEIFRKAGLIEGQVSAEQAIDLSFLEAAVKDLGKAAR